MLYTQDDLREFQPRHDFFVGIDSDGCVFDTMEPKQKECFCPVTIEKWNLASVSKYAREAWEFVNLYSKDRGCNRFIALQKTFDLLRKRPEVKRRGVEIPLLSALKAWTEKESKLGNPALEQETNRAGNTELLRVLAWSHAINEAVARIVNNIPPFPLVKECLGKLQNKADMMVISGTPGEALFREWHEHKLGQYIAIIAGQEIGSKREHLQLAACGKYPENHILMIGDAPGDYKAAKANRALFYPIIPGQEEKSWERFLKEGIDRFLSEQFAGAYETELLKEFNNSLPEKPPWGN